MVAIIKTGHSIHRIFNYNENKVKDGVAEFIGEANYPMDASEMSLTMKLNRLLKQAELNEKCKRNSVHISLNFDPSESHLTTDKMMEIAHDYMERIGFGKQPYLVYQHWDAGHPHIHIVSVKVRADGSRIDMQNIGKNQSEIARRAIEKKHDLVVADGRNNKPIYTLEPVNTVKVRYGLIPSKKAISNVLDKVLSSYNFTTLNELNAVLNQYNILADRGNENSRTFKANGMVYRILDDDRKPVGVPIKASDFYNKPTLSHLEKLFTENSGKRARFKARIKNTIDKVLNGKPADIQKLKEELITQGIYTVLRQNEDGRIYGITFVDHTSKSVFNGSSLGKNYSAKAILERCQKKQFATGNNPNTPPKEPLKIIPETTSQKNTLPVQIENELPEKEHSGNESVLDALLDTENVSDYLPNSLKKKRRKKKRRNNNNNNTSL
ncbi:relaxase/mobilization nuclease domain-containing protein [Flavobacterium cerinum]|uniref:Relaxase/mobilization nuclease domain-containing protein n=1 Tax=Flavobacterium cerinum TaxID=2502784 RepID=A0ABY5IMU5_9FLAO|nr:relaxase/mobilization nuclease domain-containing protein [Flavobacterium cerinum]UUC44168.1 relaxase/mobilization nuclease domain-containing protein [Flavobacterium cerinum]